MPNITQSITVEAPPDRAWKAVVDFPSRSRYSPRIKKAEVLGGGPLRLGSQVQVQLDGDIFRPVVQEMVPGERLVLRLKGRIYDARHIYRVRPNGSGAQVVMTGAYGGLLGGLVALMMDRSFRRDLKDELAAIKAAAEAKREGVAQVTPQ